MNKDQILQLLDIMGIDDLSISDTWVNFRCPLAITRHEKGFDRRPSAGISIHTDKPSVYKCFSCLGDSFKPLPWLFYAYWMCHDVYPYEAARFYLRGEIPTFEVQYHKIPKWERKRSMKAISICEEVLENFPLLIEHDDIIAERCKKFLLNRGIDEVCWSQFGVRYSKDYNCLVFPHTLSDGLVYYLSARRWDTKAFWGLTKEKLGVDEGHPNYAPSLKLSGSWVGYHLVDWRKPVVLVEGALDAMRLSSLGVRNVIASGGTSVTEQHIRNLIGTKYFLGYDADKPGRKTNIHLAQELDATCWVLDWSLVTCLDRATLETRPCKDGGDLMDYASYQQVFEAAKNSQLT